MAKFRHGLKLMRPKTAGKKVAELVWTAVLGIAATASAAQRPFQDDSELAARAAGEKSATGAIAGAGAEAAQPIELAEALPADIARLIQAAVAQGTTLDTAPAAIGDDVVAGSLPQPPAEPAASDTAQPPGQVYVAAVGGDTMNDAGPGIDWSNAMLLAQTNSPGVSVADGVEAPGLMALGLDMNLLGFLGVGAVAVVADRHLDATSATTPTVSNIAGTVVDGYVAGAKVFLDSNGNGILDEGDAEAGTTDAQGNFQISGSFQQGAKVFVQGGVNNGIGDGNAKLTPMNVDLQGVVDADGQIVVSPLTTLLATSGLSEAELKTALGIPADIDLLSYDPINALNGADSSTAEHVFAASQQVMTLLQTSVAAGVPFDTAAQTIGTALSGGNLGTATQAVVSTIGQTNPNFTSPESQTRLFASIENINSNIETSYSGLSEALGNPTAMANALAVTTVAQNEFLDAVTTGNGLQQFVPGSGPGFDQLVANATQDIIDNEQSLDASVLSDLLASGVSLAGENVSITFNDAGDAALLSSLLTTLGTQGAELGGVQIDADLGDFQNTLLDSLTSTGFNPDSVQVSVGDY